LPTAFSASIWGTGTGLYPYLLNARPPAAPVTPPITAPISPPITAPASEASPTVTANSLPNDLSITASVVADTTTNFGTSNSSNSFNSFSSFNFTPTAQSNSGTCCGLFYKDKRFGP
jgi:hypothetical protein